MARLKIMKKNPTLKLKNNLTPESRALNAKKTRIKIASLKATNLERKRLSNLSMSSACKEVLLGTLLGDGSLKINKGYKNARFACRHSIKQQCYFDWKVGQLNELASSRAVHLQMPSKGSYGSTPMLKFQTLTSEDLTVVHSVVTKKNKMCIQRRWLNHFTPLSLMCWWLDDGTLIRLRRQGVFCCEGFSKKEQLILVQFLKAEWNVVSRVVTHKIVQKDKNKNIVNSYSAYRIKINAVQLKKFLRIILPHIPCEGMLYKVCLTYSDCNLQQRWITELKKALPHFSSKITDFYNI